KNRGIKWHGLFSVLLENISHARHRPSMPRQHIFPPLRATYSKDVGVFPTSRHRGSPSDRHLLPAGAIMICSVAKVGTSHSSKDYIRDRTRVSQRFRFLGGSRADLKQAHSSSLDAC